MFLVDGRSLMAAEAAQSAVTECRTTGDTTPLPLLSSKVLMLL